MLYIMISRYNVNAQALRAWTQVREVQGLPRPGFPDRWSSIYAGSSRKSGGTLRTARHDSCSGGFVKNRLFGK